MPCAPVITDPQLDQRGLPWGGEQRVKLFPDPRDIVGVEEIQSPLPQDFAFGKAQYAFRGRTDIAERPFGIDDGNHIGGALAQRAEVGLPFTHPLFRLFAVAHIPVHALVADDLACLITDDPCPGFDRHHTAILVH